MVLLQHLLDDAAQAVPDRDAVRFDGRALTYATLAFRANQTAHALMANGVAKGDRVGIYLPKGFEAVIAMHAIVRVGAAYVPLDPWLPPERLAHVLDDCGISVLFCEGARLAVLCSAVASMTPVRDLRVIGASDASEDVWSTTTWSEVAAERASAVDRPIADDDLAYILYTSGSTGEPKGMMHTHRSSLSFVTWARMTFGLRGDDRVGNHAPLHFDLSLFDYFSATQAHATTVIVSEEQQKMPASLSRFIEDERLTVWYSVPLAWTQMLMRGALESRDLRTLRLVLFGGEPFPLPSLRAAMSHASEAEFWHVYGVTEANVCTAHRVSRPLPDDVVELPVGHLCSNMEAVELDGDRPVAPGETGELAVRGAAVMLGYWGQPETTRKAFWERPVPGDRTDPFYRTGDLVTRDAQGVYWLKGRADRQIKSRGHRIEFDAVQAALADVPVIDEVAVFTAADAEGSQKLCAAVSIRPGCRWNESTARRVISRRVASYAIPTTFHIVPRLPRTSAGKVDFMTLREQSPVEATAGTPRS